MYMNKYPLVMYIKNIAVMLFTWLGDLFIMDTTYAVIFVGIIYFAEGILQIKINAW